MKHILGIKLLKLKAGNMWCLWMEWKLSTLTSCQNATRLKRVLLRAMWGVFKTLLFSSVVPPPHTVNIYLSCSSVPKRQHIFTVGSNYSGAERSHLHQRIALSQTSWAANGEVLLLLSLWSFSNMSPFSSYSNSVRLALWVITAVMNWALEPLQIVYCIAAARWSVSVFIFFFILTQLRTLNNLFYFNPAVLGFFLPNEAERREI